MAASKVEQKVAMMVAPKVIRMAGPLEKLMAEWKVETMVSKRVGMLADWKVVVSVEMMV